MPIGANRRMISDSFKMAEKIAPIKGDTVVPLVGILGQLQDIIQSEVRQSLEIQKETVQAKR